MVQQAIVAARTADEEPDTTEIEALAEAAGYDVIEVSTQRRREDSGHYLGRGKAEAIGRTAATADADAVIVDGRLGPTQAHNLRSLFPDGVDVLDRERLILDVFADGATTKTAALQVEYADLKYTLPRVRAELQQGVGNEAQRPEPSQVVDGEHRRIRELQRRMDRIEAELSERTRVEARRRARRRDDGFDLLAIAGYTNAGKSTLLHRLADDLEVEDHGSDHDDLDPVAAIEDRLFRTLETTTRRVTVRGRPTLATDTVGFVDDLSHELVRSFGTTLGAARDADVVLLVADALDDPPVLTEKVRVSLDAISGRDSTTADPQRPTEDTGAPRPIEGRIVPVLNKIDRIDPDGLDERVAAIERLRDEFADEERPIAGLLRSPVPVSALEGTGIERLQDRIEGCLPAETVSLELPNCGETQAVLAWIHEHGVVEDVDYADDRVRIRCTGRPDVIERAREKAASVRAETDPTVE